MIAFMVPYFHQGKIFWEFFIFEPALRYFRCNTTSEKNMFFFITKRDGSIIEVVYTDFIKILITNKRVLYLFNLFEQPNVNFHFEI